MATCQGVAMCESRTDDTLRIEYGFTLMFHLGSSFESQPSPSQSHVPNLLWDVSNTIIMIKNSMLSDHPPSAIVRRPSCREDTRWRGHLKQSSSHRSVLLAEEPCRLLAHIRSTPKIHLKEASRAAVEHALRLWYNSEPHIVHDHVGATVG